MPIHKDRRPIRSLEDWELLAPPKSKGQWVQGRSAMEVARAWTEDGGLRLPQEVLAALEGHADFGSVFEWEAEPEAKLRFDSLPGETRNTDLAVYAKDRHGPYLLAVEAKADEPFASTVAETLAAALERKLLNPRSNGLARVEHLATTILGARASGDPEVGALRYQLLTATAGALSEAERKGLRRVLLLIHEFKTSKTDDENHKRNASDLNRFLQRISHNTGIRHAEGALLGPFTVPGHVAVQLYIAKVARNLRASMHYEH